jgi:hypothetical protein
MKSMLHGVSGREIIRRKIKKHTLKLHTSKRSENRRSSQTYMRATISLSRSIVKDPKQEIKAGIQDEDGKKYQASHTFHLKLTSQLASFKVITETRSRDSSTILL